MVVTGATVSGVTNVTVLFVTDGLVYAPPFVALPVICSVEVPLPATAVMATVATNESVLTPVPRLPLVSFTVPEPPV